MNTCAICGQQFETWSSKKGKRTYARYCRICFANKMKREPRGGGPRKDKYGYVRVTSQSGHVVSEHRMVMEQKLGRRLAVGESVHHINGIRDDNRPENLELWVGGIRYGQRAADLVCPHCNRAWLDG